MRFLPIICLASIGCHSLVGFEIDEAVTWIGVVTLRGDQVSSARALTHVASFTLYEPNENQRILGYTQEQLAAYEETLLSGPLRAAEQCRAVLPEPFWAGEARDGSITSVPIGQIPSLTAEFVPETCLIGATPFECLERGGCWVPPADESRCELPCPTPDPPVAPIAPEPPNLLPCPAGWRVRVITSTVAVCDPWSSTGRANCTGDEAHFVGEPGCSRIGTACPTGPFPDLPANRPVVYVLAGAAPGGVGTMAAPFDRIALALDVVPTGGIVALGKGTYDENVVLKDGVTLWGACVAETILSLTTGFAMGVPSGQQATAKNLQVSSALPIAVDGTLALEDLLHKIDGDTAIAVNGGALNAERLVLRGRADVEALAVGGGEAHFDHSLFEATTAIGVRTHTASVEFADFGLFNALRGLWLINGSTVACDRCVLERIGDGVWVYDSTTMTLRDTVVREVQGNGALAHGGHILGSRVFFERTGDDAIKLESGGRANISDVVVLDRVPGDRDAVDVEPEAEVVLERALILGSTQSGIEVSGKAHLSDIEVQETMGTSEGLKGHGLLIEGTVEVHRVLVQRSRSRGIHLSKTAYFTGSDLEVSDTSPEVNSGTNGSGIRISSGNIDLDRVRVTRNHYIAVEALGESTVVKMTNVSISDTQTNPTGLCTACGVSTSFGADLELERFVLRNNTVGGNILQAQLRNGLITENKTGLIAPEIFAFRRIWERVRITGNEMGDLVLYGE